MWSDFFEAGGFVMFPTLLFGFCLCAVAVAHALRPEPRWGKLVVALQVLTLGAGVLGATLGIVNTLRYLQGVPDGELARVLLQGIAESLNNVVLALIFFVFAALLTAVGALRVARARA